MSIAPSATEVLDREFLELRAEILQAAARLDRLNRAAGNPESDPRMNQLRRAIEVLSESETGRAERIQLVFSRPYNSGWKKNLQLITDH